MAHTEERRAAIAEGVKRSWAARRGFEIPEGMAWCSGHQELHPQADFNTSARQGIQSSCRDWYRDHYEANRASWNHGSWRRSLKAKYGITPEQYDEMVAAQRGLCALCGGPPNGKGRLHVDHDHATGRIRGLLCWGCNGRLGWLEKVGAKAVLDYLA